MILNVSVSKALELSVKKKIYIYFLYLKIYISVSTKILSCTTVSKTDNNKRFLIIISFDNSCAA